MSNESNKETQAQDIENSVSTMNTIASQFTTVAVGTGCTKAATVALQAANSVAKTRLTQQRIEIEQQDANSNSLVAQATAAAADNMGKAPFRHEKPVATVAPEKRKLTAITHGPGEKNETPVQQNSSEFFEKMENKQSKDATEAVAKTN